MLFIALQKRVINIQEKIKDSYYNWVIIRQIHLVNGEILKG
jgi:hypothetical protein